MTEDLWIRGPVALVYWAVSASVSLVLTRLEILLSVPLRRLIGGCRGFCIGYDGFPFTGPLRFSAKQNFNHLLVI